MATVNSAAMSTGVHVYFWNMIFSRYMPKSGIAGSYGNYGKGQFSFQSQRKAMTKNVQTGALISRASKIMLKILQARLQQYMS